MAERVSLLNSNQTLLVNDNDFTKYENWVTNGTGGVLFSDLSTKAEFGLTGTTNPTIASGDAIIVVTRATSVPIPNQKIGLRYYNGSDKTFNGAVNGSKIFIEINQALIDDPTLIEDTFPSTDFALGLNIGEMKMDTDYPATNTYIPLWEYDGSSWTDLRDYPRVDGDKVDMSDMTRDIKTSGDIEGDDITASGDITGDRLYQETYKEPVAPNELTPKQYVDSEILQASSVEAIVDRDTHILGEDATEGDSVFVEDSVTYAEADQEQAIGDTADNTRVAIPAFGSGVASNTLKLALRKYVDPAVDLGVRIETDDNGQPSGDLIDPNAEATVLASSLSDSVLEDKEVTFAGVSENNTHGVTLDNTTPNTKAYQGVKITLTQQVSVLTVVKDSDCTATHAYIYDMSGNELAKTTFATDTATFNYSDLINGESYYILAGSEGADYTTVKQTGATSFPYSEARLDYEAGAAKVFVTDSHGISLGFGPSQSQAFGFRFITNKKISVFEVTKSSTSAVTRAILKTVGGSVISTTSFAGNVANFGGIVLQQGVEYRIEADGNGSSVQTSINNSPTLPQNRTNINYLGGSFDGNNRSDVRNIESITTLDLTAQENTDLNNIVDITTSDTVLVPKGQRCHIVLYPGVYGSETINATNYFGVGYADKNTSTRPLGAFDGTDWTEDNDNFAYVDSDLFTPKILSKTDATYSYKLPTDLPRILTESKNAGETAIATTFGLNDKFSGLEDDRVYFIADTPGAISLEPGTNVYGMGKSIIGNKFFVNKDIFYTLAGTIATAADLPTSRSTTSSSFVIVKQTRVPASGFYRIERGTFASGSGTVLQSRIYRNGVAYGTTQQTFAGSPDTKTETSLFFVEGDTCELWIRRSSGSGNVSVSNMLVQYTIPSLSKIGTDNID